MHAKQSRAYKTYPLCRQQVFSEPNLRQVAAKTMSDRWLIPEERPAVLVKKSRGDMEIHKAYAGREHSLIKHELLKGYLETLLCIAAVSGVQ